MFIIYNMVSYSLFKNRYYTTTTLDNLYNILRLSLSKDIIYFPVVRRDDVTAVPGLPKLLKIIRCEREISIISNNLIINVYSRDHILDSSFLCIILKLVELSIIGLTYCCRSSLFNLSKVLTLGKKFRFERRVHRVYSW